MLDSAIKEQLRTIFAAVEANYTFDITVSPQHESRTELLELLNDVASCSEKLSCRIKEGKGLEFTLLKGEHRTGITFRAVPNGHEFSSLLLAILNTDGKGKNFPDEGICNRVKSLKGPVRLTTYVSLTCTNCPDVVQALNAMTTLNGQIQHQTVDGAINQAEVEALKIQGVPSVFADGKLIHVGRGDFGELLAKLEEQYGTETNSAETSIKKYDVIVAGGGPAGSAAAIYSARKGLNVAVIAERIGGQVKETVGIENLISVPSTTGSQLADNLKTHMSQYPIDLLEHRQIEKIELDGKDKVLTAKGGERFSAPAVIVATGASWRKLNVPSEAEYIGRGVAFCPHCDGPFYKGKQVAVVGGGNSGIEAAIDLAGICSPGLSAAPAIGEYAVCLLGESGLTLEKKEEFICKRHRTRFKELPPEERAALVERQPAFGRVICRCETVTEGEILEALAGPIPPHSVDAVKRRVNAGMGRCQSGFCQSRVVAILARELGCDPSEVLLEDTGSWLVEGPLKGVR